MEPDEIYHFLETLTEGLAKSSRRLRYAQLKAFYNFIITRCSLDMKNPCNAPLLSKTFRMPKAVSRKILDKEVVDEMIYNTQSPRDRLMLELQARCGLRIGESLKIKVSDISERKILLREPKSGKEAEVAFMPEPVAKRLNDYIKDQGLQMLRFLGVNSTISVIILWTHIGFHAMLLPVLRIFRFRPIIQHFK
jgi:integrase